MREACEGEGELVGSIGSEGSYCRPANIGAGEVRECGESAEGKRRMERASVYMEPAIVCGRACDAWPRVIGGDNAVVRKNKSL